MLLWESNAWWSEVELRRWCWHWGATADTGEASLTGPPLTSCCAAQLLTGHGPVLVCGLGTGNPWMGGINEIACNSQHSADHIKHSVNVSCFHPQSQLRELKISLAHHDIVMEAMLSFSSIKTFLLWPTDIFALPLSASRVCFVYLCFCRNELSVKE